jgi:hypothetical protein
MTRNGLPVLSILSRISVVEPRVLLYELNEVPWEIIDLYVAARPQSNLSRLLPRALLRTTIDDDPVDLMPWRSWPTFHTSLFTPDHNSYDQGQDPATFRGTPLWEAADDGGARVGLFGVLQSWPPTPFRNGGFYVPDSFARSPETVPVSLRRFQAFNTAMTDENSFAPDRALSPVELAKVGADLLLRGLSLRSVVLGMEQLVRERTDLRYASRRAVAQVLVCFDVFWRLHRRHDPNISIFFTNHVASMMHRFWGDLVPSYRTCEAYTPDDVRGRFIVTAMDRFDHGLGKIVRWIDRTPGSTLIVASSMGQDAIPYHAMSATYVLDDGERMLEALGLQARMGVAMYPRITLMFGDEESAAAAVEPVTSAATAVGPLFRDLRLMGTTLSFEMGYAYDAAQLPREVTWVPALEAARTADISELGVVVRERPGGGNTAQHVPDGMLIAYGRGVEADGSRAEVSVLDAAPSILSLLGIAPAPSMQGRPSLFANRAQTVAAPRRTSK